MKIKHNRRVYDTDKAEKVFTAKKSFGNYGENPDNDWTETLYMKPNFEFFVFGEGGKNTPYNTDSDTLNFMFFDRNNYTEAQLWVHDNCPELYTKLFTDKEDERVSTTMALSQKAVRNLKRYTCETRISASECLRLYAESLYD